MPKLTRLPPNAADGIADAEVTIVGGSVTATIPAGTVLGVTDNGGSLTVDDGATTLSIDDAGASITVDGAVNATITQNPLPVSGVILNTVNTAIVGTPSVNATVTQNPLPVSGVILNTVATTITNTPTVDIGTIPTVTANVQTTAGNPLPVSGVISGSVNASVTGSVDATVINEPTVHLYGSHNDYPIAVSGVVTAGISNTSEIGTSVSTALDIPENLEGTLEQIQVADYVVQETLMEILKQLKIMNLHLSLMTDTWIRKQDIFDV